MKGLEQNEAILHSRIEYTKIGYFSENIRYDCIDSKSDNLRFENSMCGSNSKDSITSDKGFCDFYSPEGISRSRKRPERIHNYLSDFGRKPRINGTKLRTYETIENTIRNNSLSRTKKRYYPESRRYDGSQTET